MKRANNTFESFRILNAELSRAENYFVGERERVQEKLFEVKKGRKKRIVWEGKL